MKGDRLGVLVQNAENIFKKVERNTRIEKLLNENINMEVILH
jgi:hypothetical protein